MTVWQQELRQPLSGHSPAWPPGQNSGTTPAPSGCEWSRRSSLTRV